MHSIHRSVFFLVWSVSVLAMGLKSSGQSLYYLNFDPDTPGVEYPYSEMEKGFILDGIKTMYAAFPHMMFTLDEPVAPYSMVNFNSTAIGTSTGIDFRNVASIDSASINALMAFDFLGEGSPTPADVVKASINLASHEIGHLEGLRHHDAYTPIGSGMPATVVADYFPAYPGPTGAPFTFTDVQSLTTSIVGGFTVSQLTSDLIVGQRSAIKLAYNADPGFSLESSLPGGSAGSDIATAEPLPLKTIGVPNVTLPGDPIHGMNLLADVFAVRGSVDDVGGTSESDFYSFFAQEDDFVQIEVLSDVISSRLDEFDVAVNIYDPEDDDPDNLFILYYGTSGNADERESSDALILDFHAPATQSYVIEVFAQFPHDPVGDYELYVAAFRPNPIPEPAGLLLALLGLVGLVGRCRRR